MHYSVTHSLTDFERQSYSAPYKVYKSGALVTQFCILSTCWRLQASLAEVLENTLISLGPNAGYGLVVMMIMDMMGVARAGCPGWWWCVTRHLGHPCPGLGEWPGPHSWWQQPPPSLAATISLVQHGDHLLHQDEAGGRVDGGQLRPLWIGQLTSASPTEQGKAEKRDHVMKVRG